MGHLLRVGVMGPGRDQRSHAVPEWNVIVSGVSRKGDMADTSAGNSLWWNPKCCLRIGPPLTFQGYVNP